MEAECPCYMRLTLPDGSKAFMRRVHYRAVHKMFARAEFAHLLPNSVLLRYLPNRLTSDEIVVRAIVKESQVAPDQPQAKGQGRDVKKMEVTKIGFAGRRAPRPLRHR